MKIDCETHGEVEAYVDKNMNAWCQECRTDAIREGLKNPEKLRELSHAMMPQKLPPVTCYKPGTPGYVPPPPRPFGEIAGYEPPYSDEPYTRRIRELDLEEEGS